MFLLIYSIKVGMKKLRTCKKYSCKYNKRNKEKNNCQAEMREGKIEMKKIFETVRLPHLQVKNRLVRSATWEGVAKRNGSPTEDAYRIYEELAKGGVGLIITGFTSVDINDQYFGGMMRLADDGLVPEYKKLVDLIHKEGVPVIAQLALGGYYRPDVSGRMQQLEPDDLTQDQIFDVIQMFKEAARRAKDAGYDGVQIHAAHFFFLSRFISPAYNHRTDAWGGSTEKRAKIVVEILRAIRSVAPELHVTVKINCSDFTLGGLEPEESLEISKILAAEGIDSIEVSGNGTSVSGIKAHVNEAYFGGFAAKLAEEVDTPIILVGGLRAKDTMEAVLNQTKIALLSLSRPLLCEPDWPNKLQTGASMVSRCISCNGCYSSPCHQCVFRK